MRSCWTMGEMKGDKSIVRQALLDQPSLVRAKSFAGATVFMACFLVHAVFWGWTEALPSGRFKIFRCEAEVLQAPSWTTRRQDLVDIVVRIVSPEPACGVVVRNKSRQRSVVLPPAFLGDARLAKGTSVAVVFGEGGGRQQPWVAGVVSAEGRTIAGPHAIQKAIDLANDVNRFWIRGYLFITLAAAWLSLWGFWQYRKSGVKASDDRARAG